MVRAVNTQQLAGTFWDKILGNTTVSLFESGSW